MNDRDSHVDNDSNPNALDALSISSASSEANNAHPNSITKRPRIYGTGVRTAIAIFAFALPIFSAIFEIGVGAMAEIYVDPIPTVWHIVAGAVLLVSILSIDICLGRTREGNPPKRIAWAFFLNGYALALAAIYFFLYLPILPIAVICLMFMGLGLMGFSPLACVLATAYQMRTLYVYLPEFKINRSRVVWSTVAGIALVILLAAGYAGPDYVSNEVLEMAVSDDAKTRERGIEWIETLGFENRLLAACYAPVVRGVGPSRRWNSLALGKIDECRELYFRITGVPYNSVPRPNIRSTFRNRSAEWWEEERQADSEVGGMAVAGRVAGLSLASSSIDGKIFQLGPDPSDPALAYLEWIIEFNNESSRQREARARIEIPHGAVASRLTLWIDGEEREAAFGAREQVLAAYQDVAVVRRCDPALLNVVGQDTLMLQCFPIQPRSTMRVKVGITAPLTVRDGSAYFRLPYVSERNFTISPDFAHQTRIESDLPLQRPYAALNETDTDESRFALAGDLSETDLQESGTLSFAMKGLSDKPYTDALGEFSAEMTVVQRERPAGKPVFCLVVDGSKGMENATIDWGALIGALPSNAQTNAVFAGKSVEKFSEIGAAPTPELAEWIRVHEFRGGCDPVPALLAALEWLDEKGGTILWIHGPLPVELSSTESLYLWDKERDSTADVRILSVQAVPGPNRALEQLGKSAMLERVPVLGSLDETLRYAVIHRSSGDVDYAFTLATNTGSDATPRPGSADGHVVRLAANNLAMRATLERNPDLTTEATEMAVASRIVTPLSGAVVLENAAQYERHGLDPTKNPESIPGVPEPEEWALLIVVLVVLAGLAVHQRRGRAMARA